MLSGVLGTFQIQRELGRGGMGEVYLARDTRLDRLVAIKALPEHLSRDPDRLARFQREAKVLASLSHPSIGAIHGLEESGGRQYLVLEFIEGETLADRLTRGPIPLDDALAYARQIADALDAAHEKSVIHRDLKPGNVMITPDGQVKVLDFGLARTADSTAATPSTPGAPDSPTLMTPMPVHSPTIPGVIMGTAGYMSPEQARGKPVDKRSDIFSFGCVLYEMLSGATPFQGETAADAIGATLHKELDFGLLPPATPNRVRELLANCLAKDRKQRLRDIGDARLELERAIREPHGGAAAGGAQAGYWRLPAVLATVLLAAASLIVGALVFGPTGGTSAGSTPVIRSTLELPKGTTLISSDRAIAVSPDGRRVVVSAGPTDGPGPALLYVRDLARLEYRTLAGTDDATYPFWSPDGRSIAYFSGQKLKRIDLADGVIRTICDAPAGRGGTWSTKGTIIFAPSASGGLSIVSGAGGTPAPITTVETQGESHRVPQMLPDGERFLFYNQHADKAGIYAFDPGTRKAKLVTISLAEGVFVEPGSLVFASEENLIVQPFDVERLELTGTPQPIAAGVHYNLARVYISMGISSRGTLAYQLVNREARAKLGWMDRKGERTILPVEPISIDVASLAADSRRAAVSIRGDRGGSSVAVVDLERGTRTPLGDPAAIFHFGVLMSRDGQRLMTTAYFKGSQQIIALPINGGPAEVLIEATPGMELSPSSITPDARTLLFTQTPLLNKTGDIVTQELGKPGTGRRFLETPDAEWNPTVSPSGEFVAYAVSKEESTISMIKVVAYPTPTGSLQVSVTPATLQFGWLSPSELYWVDASRQVWSATISAKDGQIDAGKPKPMFDGRPLDPQVRVLAYDIAHERFLVGIESQASESAAVILVNDWRAEVQGTPASRK
jgi:Tol biopolymer transport system component